MEFNNDNIKITSAGYLDYLYTKLKKILEQGNISNDLKNAIEKLDRSTIKANITYKLSDGKSNVVYLIPSFNYNDDNHLYDEYLYIAKNRYVYVGDSDLDAFSDDEYMNYHKNIDVLNELSDKNGVLIYKGKSIGSGSGSGGIDGEDGKTFIPKIGTVVVVDDTEDASVTVDVDQDAETATYNFKIPKGPKGDAGENGKDGAKGEKGDRGISISDFDIVDGKIVVELEDGSKLEGVRVPSGTVNISKEEGNIIEQKEDGLFAKTAGGESVLAADVTSNVEVGGIPTGTKFKKGTKLEDIISRVLVKYLPPTVTFSINPNTTLKLFGDKIASETLTVTTVKKSYDITEIIFRVGSNAIETKTEGVSSGGTFTHTYKPDGGITNSVTVSVDVNDGTQKVTKSITITFCYPTYYGVVADSVTTMSASDIQALTNRVAVNAKGKTWSGINMPYGKICYAYPKSFGALTSIKDANNVDYINSYARTEVTLRENDTDVIYYCYLLKDAAGVSNFKQVYA